MFLGFCNQVLVLYHKNISLPKNTQTANALRVGFWNSKEN